MRSARYMGRCGRDTCGGHRWPLAFLIIAGLLGCQHRPLVSVVPVKGAAEWPNYGRDAGGTRYAPLDQITPDNVGKLRSAWIYRTGDSSVEASYVSPVGNVPNFEATPIMVDGTLYLSTPVGRALALDPGRGTTRWEYDAHIDRAGDYGDFSNRGVATWVDPERGPGERCRRRVYLVTIDARVIALDAASGGSCTDFGNQGILDLTKGLRNPPEYVGEYEETSPPAIVNGMLIIGSGVADNNRIDSPDGVVRAFDARTGALRWSWDPVPQDSSDSAWTTWTGPRSHRSGGANAWTALSVDSAHDRVFVPTASATTEYYGGERVGLNAYANSVVALRAATGERLWHFQLTHHDLWDYDVAAPPALVELRRVGSRTSAVLQTGKTAQLFVLDAATGRPVFPVEERPAPHSTVPGEAAWPTQPFSAAISPLSPLRVDSVWGATPSDRAECRALLASLRNDGIFTPPSLEGSITIPSTIGGAQWGGLAFDPVRQIAVVPVNRRALIVQLIPRAAYDAAREERGWQYQPMTGTPYVARRRPFEARSGWPCTPPPFGALVAVDLTTGHILWNVPLGSQRQTALAEGIDDPGTDRWGGSVLGGPIVTASGLVFVAGTGDAFLRAFDERTGRELWRGRLPDRGKATPMTYAIGGRQYVVIASGADHLRGRGATVVAFALPTGVGTSD